MLKKKLLKLGITILFASSLFACTNITNNTNTKPVNSDVSNTQTTDTITTETTESNKVESIVVSKELKDLYDEKSLNIKTAKNVRQLGGFVTKDGKKVKENLLIRGAHIADISDEEAQIFKDKYNIKEVVDFRTDYERNKQMDKTIDGINNTWLTVLTFSLDKDKIEELTDNYEINKMIAYYKYNGGLDEMYEGLVDEKLAQDGFSKFFNILLNNDGATYWHCTNGKDRTGFAAVLLLSALGVDEKTILDDYEASIVAKVDEMNMFISALNDINYNKDEILKIAGLTGIDRSSMEKALRIIDEKYDGMNSYLHNQIGLTDDDIQILKDKYLEE